MKLRMLILIYNAALFMPIASCAPVSSAGIYRTSVELTIPSAKAPRDFATCVAGVLPDVSQVLNDGDHYWVVRSNGGAAFERWDFTPTPAGSIAERRSGTVAPSYGSDRVRSCASS